MFVRPQQLAKTASATPRVVRRESEAAPKTLGAECPSPSEDLQRQALATVRDVTKFRGTIELAGPGSLPNDGKVIADEQ